MKNTVIPSNFLVRKLGETTVFFAVSLLEFQQINVLTVASYLGKPKHLNRRGRIRQQS